jgi:uncharacterized protein YndB with AHSA1/START domain
MLRSTPAMGNVPPDTARLAVPTDASLGRRIAVEVERTVDAPIQRVWTVLRDFVAARPRMLTAHFADYAVQGGGQGAGTVIDFRLRVGRRERRYLVRVEEPTPGRQLRERDHHSRLVITWTLTPGGEGERTVVRLAVTLRDPQVSGWLARRRARRALRRLYGQLLKHLDRYLTGYAAPSR